MLQAAVKEDVADVIMVYGWQFKSLFYLTHGKSEYLNPKS